jgi:hypothetical protein
VYWQARSPSLRLAMRTREIACLGNSLTALLSIHCTDSLFLCNRCSPVLSAAARKFGSTATSCRNSWHAGTVGRSAPVRRPLHRRPSAGTNAPRPLERTRLQRPLANLALNQQPDDLVFRLHCECPAVRSSFYWNDLSSDVSGRGRPNRPNEPGQSMVVAVLRLPRRSDS